MTVFDWLKAPGSSFYLLEHVKWGEKQNRYNLSRTHYEYVSPPNNNKILCRFSSSELKEKEDKKR